jgi:F-type H+-transporting ATPase subunit gamma
LHGEVKHPLLEQREVRNRGILLVTTGRGLCGALNSNLFRVVSELKGDARFVSMGRKGTQFLSRTKRDLMAEFPLSDHVPISEIRPAADFLIKAFLDHEVDTLEIVFSQFVNTLVQKPVCVPLLPLGNIAEILETLRGNAGLESGDALKRDEREMSFEPGADKLLDLLLPMFIKGQIFQMARSAKASEHSARMVAMKTAKDNASKLLDDLTLVYNKARQAAITAEILEIAAATAADSD